MPPGIVEVVPNGYDPDRFGPDGPRMELPTGASCVFLFVGGTIWRKGVDLLLAAWERPSAPATTCALVIKDFGAPAPGTAGRPRSRGMRSSPGARDVAPIVYLDQEIPAREMPTLYRAADVWWRRIAARASVCRRSRRWPVASR